MKKEIAYAVFTALTLLGCSDETKQKTQKKEVSDAANLTERKMENKSFTAAILVDQSPAEAFSSILNFRGWWSEEIEGKTDQLNEEFFYHYQDIHLCKMKLIEWVPNKKIVYLVTENEFNFVEDKSEWVNTKLIFEITGEEGKTKVKFTHEGLVPEYACYKVCNDAWSGYIKNSLYKLITTGKGEPNPKDKDGFNAQLAEKWGLTEK